MTGNETPRCICVVGSANVDLIFRTPRLPGPGETLAGRTLHQCMGGKGANQAVVAARLGAVVRFVACVGNDGFGAQALKAYEAEGIDTSFVRRAESQPTGTAAIFVDDEAENCIVVVPGANAKLSTTDIQDAKSAIQESAVVLCQLETAVDVAIAAFRLARSVGALTVLTPAPANAVTDELLELCDVCVPNRTEIAQLVGESVDNESDAIRAAQRLRDRGAKRIALTLGGDGVLLADDSGVVHLPAFQVEPVDTTGAGDAFTSALAVSLADGLSFLESAKRAVVVAGISVAKAGTQTSFPSRSEVAAWEE